MYVCINICMYRYVARDLNEIYYGVLGWFVCSLPNITDLALTPKRRDEVRRARLAKLFALLSKILKETKIK